MKVKNSMHKGVQWVSPDTPVTALAAAMREQDIGAIPVGENDRLVGMVTDRDIAVRAVANGRDISALTARDVMTNGIVWCRDSDRPLPAALSGSQPKAPGSAGGYLLLTYGEI
jgi:CBS domain-containing protein